MIPGIILTHQQRAMLALVERSFETVFMQTGKIPVCLFVDATTWAKFMEFCPPVQGPVRAVECNGVPVFQSYGIPPDVGWLYCDKFPDEMRPPDHTVVFA